MTVAYDPLDPAFRADPYPAYAALREERPVHHHPGAPGIPEFWSFARFDDIWDAVREPATYSSARGLTFHPDEIGKLGIPPTIVMLDPPVQTALRSLIGRAFTPRRIASMEQKIRDFVRERIADLTERAAAGEEVDLHQLVSSPFRSSCWPISSGCPRAIAPPSHRGSQRSRRCRTTASPSTPNS